MADLRKSYLPLSLFFAYNLVLQHVYLNGEYGAKEIYAGVPVIIGSGGVEKIIELELSADEKVNFDKSVAAVRDLYSEAKKIDPSL